MSWIFVPIASLLLAPAPHIPHDNANDVAVRRTSGGWEIVVAVNERAKVLRSTDLGLRWEPVAGEGLERHMPLAVEHWPHASRECFLLGTSGGVWTYDPASGAVRAASAGLPPDDRTVVSLSVARTSLGPAFLVTESGNVYSRAEPDADWVLRLSSGWVDSHAQVAVDPQGGSEEIGTGVLAAVAGMLHVSPDGGRSWTVHPQFAVPAQSETDWTITALALAHDYALSGIAVIGRGREEPASPTGQEGELWRKGGFGSPYQLVQSLSSPPRALATARGPAERRDFFAAVQQYPDPELVPQAPGVLRSTDGGRSWSDGGNFQDFFLESEADRTDRVLLEFQGIGVSPDYAQDELLLLARGEGLFRSASRGARWRQLRVRSELHVRDLVVAKDAGGDVLAFGGTYGSGTILANVTRGETRVLAENKVHYQKGLGISPHFAADGTLAVAGVGGASFWFDPAKPPANPFGLSGFQTTEDNPYDYAKKVAFSPRYDGTGGTPGSDLALFLGAGNGNYRSLNGGLSFEPVSLTAGGGNAPNMLKLVVAPTFRADSSTTRTDVYGATRRRLFRLDDTRWVPRWDSSSEIESVVVVPDFSRPDNPGLLLAVEQEPFLVAIVDRPEGVEVTPLEFPGMDGEIRAIDVAPDFATHPVVYAVTWGRGVKRLDLGEASPRWRPVGGSFPPVWGHALRLSPDFATDGRILVGTQRGILVGHDQPGAAWTLLPTSSVLSTRDPGLTFFQPADPGNPDPGRPWPWPESEWQELRPAGIRVTDTRFRRVASDGAYFEWEGWASAFELHTFQGPGVGAVTLRAVDPGGGAELARRTVSLTAAGSLSATQVRLDLPATVPARLRVTAHLDPGQGFAFDALTVVP